MLPIDTILQTAEIEARLSRRSPWPHPYRPAPAAHAGRGLRRMFDRAANGPVNSR